MGLLDDAIREHLELKRRRGGDPAEIERAEREALGPVRRHPESAEPAPYAESKASSEPLVEQPAEIPPAPSGAEFVDSVVGSEPAAPPPHPAGGSIESEDRPELPPLEPADHLDQATVEYHVGLEDEHDALSHDPAPPEPLPHEDLGDDDLGHEPAGSDPLPREDDPDREDVLEETPEFLQDAPEHDRLWFEQRPPRDFDFDG